MDGRKNFGLKTPSQESKVNEGKLHFEGISVFFEIQIDLFL